jgi:DNA-binding NtrC family response regulator
MTVSAKAAMGHRYESTVDSAGTKLADILLAGAQRTEHSEKGGTMRQPHILVVDDEPATRQILSEFLTAEGYDVTAVEDGPSAIQVVKEEPVHAIVTDLRLPEMDGFELLEQVWQVRAHLPSIVMTGYGTIANAVRAMKAGAFDFVTKPIQFDAVSVVIKKALEFHRLRQENLLLKKTVREQYGLHQLIGMSEEVRTLQEFVERVADSDSTILIQGESGTGKELVARMLHFNSLRRDRQLVPVNCGAIPENMLESELFGHEKGAFTDAVSTRIGRFELAHGGTLFLDEVGEMSLPLQVKLLRVLQERSFERVGGNKTIRVDVRVLAATNQDLEQAVQEGRFRKDLYYRLNVIPITVPPLRERRSDIPLLVDHSIQRFNAAKQAGITGVAPDAMTHLVRYDWPGNIRELENLLERLVILKKSGMIAAADLPEKIRQSAPLSFGPSDSALHPDLIDGDGINLMKELERYEDHLIVEALRKSNGVTSKAAELLRLNRTTLIEKLKRKGLDAKVYASSSA